MTHRIQLDPEDSQRYNQSARFRDFVESVANDLRRDTGANVEIVDAQDAPLATYTNNAVYLG